MALGIWSDDEDIAYEMLEQFISRGTFAFLWSRFQRWRRWGKSLWSAVRWAVKVERHALHLLERHAMRAELGRITRAEAGTVDDPLHALVPHSQSIHGLMP